VTHRNLSPAIEAKPPKVKRRPRGKPFPKGHSIGLAHRFRKGESGNPHGRPKSAEISKALRKKLASEISLPRAGRAYAEKLVDKWVEQALRGNTAAIAAIADRADGRPGVTLSLNDAPDPLQQILDEMTRVSREIGPPEGYVPRLKEAEPVS
jgi:hypothetical protein